MFDIQKLFIWKGRLSIDIFRKSHFSCKYDSWDRVRIRNYEMITYHVYIKKKRYEDKKVIFENILVKNIFPYF